MKSVLLYGLFCFGWCGSFQVIQADPIVPLSYTFTTINVPGSTSTSLYGINNAGQIVGAYTDSTGTHGFLDTNGTFTTLPFVPTGINNVGQIVGLSSNAVVLDTNGSLTNIVLPNFQFFTGGVNGTPLARINDLGQIVGTYEDPQAGVRAFVYSDGAFTFLPVGFEQTVSANKINNSGQIVVTIAGFVDFGTYLYQNGQYTPIFTGQQGLNFIASSALNNVGQIVGTNAGGTYVYTNGIIGDFSFYPYGVATDINDAGQIVGGNALATPVPEPASLLVFAGGLVAMGLLRRARQMNRNNGRCNSLP